MATFCLGASEVPSINDMMSIEDQRRTGVIRLKQNQKMQLAKWLVAHGFYERHEKVTPKAPPLYLKSNIGSQMTLSDDSDWEIAPEDVKTAKDWKDNPKVRVEKTKNPVYPYKIYNLETKGNEYVKARFPFSS
ncbi:MAG: hypothetical protein S4CHLAM37_09120 [Chlamydiia bacterium]|nr:hypothetical protein [Chlamydiia bacterium]